MDQHIVNNPQAHEPARPSIKEIRSQAEALKIRSMLHLRQVAAIWSLPQEDLLKYFKNYESMPFARVTTDLLFDLEKVKMVRTDNKVYLGEIYQKKKQGRGIVIYKTGKIYQGQFHLNEKSGFGVETYENGNVYIGTFAQNKKHGKGSFFWFNITSHQDQKQIEQYHGDWWGGLPDGTGEHVKAIGDVYVGKFKNGLKHGEGIEMYVNGDKYKGSFINGLPEGYGEYVWVDGSSYKGDFKQGTRNGYGMWRSPKGQKQSYKGHYMLDKKHGYGIYDWGNGYVYKGFWLGDLRYGEGTLYCGQEVEYDGFWENGEKVEYNPHKKQQQSLPKVTSKRQLTQTTLTDVKTTFASRSKVTERFTNSQEKKRVSRIFSGEKSRKTNVEEFQLSYKKQTSHDRGKCGHKNCIPTLQIGKMPRPPWQV